MAQSITWTLCVPRCIKLWIEHLLERICIMKSLLGDIQWGREWGYIRSRGGARKGSYFLWRTWHSNGNSGEAHKYQFIQLWDHYIKLEYKKRKGNIRKDLGLRLENRKGSYFLWRTWYIIWNSGEAHKGQFIPIWDHDIHV